MPKRCSAPSCRGSNTLAIAVCAASMLALYTSFDPVPAGEDLASDQSEAAAEKAASFVIQDEVPVPPDATVVPNTALQDHDQVTDAAQSAAVQPSSASENVVILNDNEAIQFTTLLLQDGLNYLQSIDKYSTVFTKQERINGDLTDTQIIEMKVQHSPGFGVYMKWKNGDAGRQVLFNEEYEDSQMVVKLGGLKGRLLPAIKLDPRGDRAMSESRYPVTEAGLMGMLKQIVAHRQEDLNRGHGVKCRRLPNQEFDGRNCMCFVYEYESPEIHPTYRKSLILIDNRHHVPLMARNYTWAVETEGLTAEQLDELTLIENYSFTSINFAAELVAEDFSRENRRYRM